MPGAAASGAEGLFKVEAGAANPWPAIDVAADSYFIRQRDVGRVEFVGAFPNYKAAYDAFLASL